MPRNATTPLAVFDELWTAFSYHCAFLHLRSSTRDWHLDSFREQFRARAAALRPQTAEAATSPDLLGILGILADVVRLFSADDGEKKPDIHCFLTTAEAASAGSQELASNDPPEWTSFEVARRERWMEHAATLAHAEGVRQAGLFRFGMAAAEVGYIQLNAMDGFSSDTAPGGGFAQEYSALAAVEACMQEAVPFFKQHGARGVILDVRFNSGGEDHIGMTVASHFFAKPAVGFSKRSRLPMREYRGPEDQLEWTDYSIDSVITPCADPELTFAGPVAVLISGYTLSAAEVFTLIMQAHPDCTFIGAPTCGCYSDILGTELANGWIVGLSNQFYTNHEGANYEGVGLAPDMAVGDSYPSESELAEGADAVLSSAVELLSSSNTSRL